MSQNAGNAIIAKAKAIYGKRLLPEDYEQLLRMNSISDIVGYLKKHDKFTDTLGDVDEYSIHRGQLENLIRKSYFRYLTRLVKFVNTTDRRFYQLDMIKREIEIVLSSIRSIISGSLESAIRDLPMFFKRHASFDIEDVTKALTMEQLLTTLNGTRYYDVISPYETNDPSLIRYADIEHDLYGMYHEIVINRINRYYKGRNKLLLMNMYQSKVEIENIIKIYRLKKFYNADSSEIMKSIITDKIRMKDETLRDLVNAKDPNDILKMLSKSDEAQFKDDDEYVYIEYQAEKIKYNLAKRFMYTSDFPAIVYSALLFLHEIEQTNLFNIIEGIRYDIDKEDIEKMIIY